MPTTRSKQKIDIIMYRITDQAHVDALIILSPADFLTTAPGARRNDTTIISP